MPSRPLLMGGTGCARPDCVPRESKKQDCRPGPAPEGGIVAFAHGVVIGRRAELQALGQQPCGGKASSAQGHRAGHTLTHTRTHACPPRHRHSPHPPHTCSLMIPETHMADTLREDTHNMFLHSPTLTQPDQDTHTYTLQRPHPSHCTGTHMYARHMYTKHTLSHMYTHRYCLQTHTYTHRCVYM